jgi:hypothetical protein
VEGLSPEQLQAVQDFVSYLRSPDGAKALIRSDFARFWDDWKRRAPNLSDGEAESLVSEAVAFARGRA